MDAYRIRELIEFAEQRSRDYSLSNADIAAFRDTAAALRELMQRSQPPVVQQPEARGVVDGWKLIIHTSERDNEPGVWAEKDGSRIWIAALTEARNVR